ARRAAAQPAQLSVDLSVGQAGPVVVGGHQRVELPAQQDAALAGGTGGGALLRGRGARPRGGPLLRLALGEQRRDLVGGEQAGQAEVLLFLGGTRADRGTERGAVEDHLIEFGGRGEQLDPLVQLVGRLFGTLR